MSCFGYTPEASQRQGRSGLCERNDRDKRYVSTAIAVPSCRCRIIWQPNGALPHNCVIRSGVVSMVQAQRISRQTGSQRASRQSHGRTDGVDAQPMRYRKHHTQTINSRTAATPASTTVVWVLGPGPCCLLLCVLGARHLPDSLTDQTRFSCVPDI